MLGPTEVLVRFLVIASYTIGISLEHSFGGLSERVNRNCQDNGQRGAYESVSRSSSCLV